MNGKKIKLAFFLYVSTYISRYGMVIRMLDKYN